MKKYFLAFAIIPLLAASCATTKPTTPPRDTVAGFAAGSLRDQIGNTQTAIQNAVAPLTESGQHIDNAKVAVLTTNSPAAIVKELDSAKSKIEEGKNFVIQANASALLALNTATQNVFAVEQLKQTNATLEKANAKLEADLKKERDSKIDWIFNMMALIAGSIIVAGVCICIASAAIGFASVRTGVTVSTGGVALLFLTLTLKKYQDQFTLFCGVVIGLAMLGLIGYFCRQLYVSAKANKELVQFGEALKTHVAPDFKKTLFGDNSAAISTSIADSVQSDSTQAIVKKLRKHIAIEKINKAG